MPTTYYKVDKVAEKNITQPTVITPSENRVQGKGRQGKWHAVLFILGNVVVVVVAGVVVEVPGVVVELVVVVVDVVVVVVISGSSAGYLWKIYG